MATYHVRSSGAGWAVCRWSPGEGWVVVADGVPTLLLAMSLIEDAQQGEKARKS